MSKISSTVFSILLISASGFSEKYEIIALGTFGGIESSAYAINDYGYVVGTVRYERTSEQPFPTQAFVWNANQSILLSPDTYQSSALSINNQGEIVGSVKKDTVSPTTAFYWNSQIGMQYFDMPEDIQHSTAYGINNSEQMIVYTRQSDDYWALKFVSYAGNMSAGFAPINYPTPLGGIALAISDSGHIVGTACPDLEQFNTRRGYIWQNGELTFFEGLGGDSDMVWSVNSSGSAVGYSYLSALPAPQIYHAALWENGHVYDLGTLGGTNSQAHSINENGLIVGFAEIADGSQHACLWKGMQIIDLNDYLPVDSEWSYLKSAIDINIYGQIVGIGIIDGREQAFLMTPIPEPATISLFALGAFLAGRKRT